MPQYNKASIRTDTYYNEIKRDYSILKKLELELPPVAVKFTFDKPEGFARRRSGPQLAYCEMAFKAFDGEAFYCDRESHNCIGRVCTGMEEPPVSMLAGQVGPPVGAYSAPRANVRFWADSMPRLPWRDSIQYIAFAPLDEAPYEPDVLIITGNYRQIEIVLRATTYQTGRLYEAKGSDVIICYWMMTYPYLTGKVNWGVIGTSSSFMAQGIGKPGDMWIAIPWNEMHEVLESLENMPWIMTEWPRAEEGLRYGGETSAQMPATWSPRAVAADAKKYEERRKEIGQAKAAAAVAGKATAEGPGEKAKATATSGEKQ